MEPGESSQEAGPAEKATPASSLLKQSSVHLQRLVREEDLSLELKQLKEEIAKAEEGAET